MRFLVKTFGKMPDDPFYEDINPYLKVWLYESWLHDRKMESERLRNQAILIGSFFNPEMAQRMVKDERPDFKTTDLDQTTQMVRDHILKEEEKANRKKRKKRKVLNNG